MDVPTIGQKRLVIVGATGMVGGYARMAFARYKREAENTRLASKFPRLYIFRPAYIYPVEPRKEPNLSYRVLRGIYPLFRALFPKSELTTWPVRWWMLSLPEQGQPQARFPRIATSVPLSVRFTDPRTKKRKV